MPRRRTATTGVASVEPTMYSPEQVKRLNAKAAQLRILRDQMAELKERAEELAAALSEEMKVSEDWVDLGDVDVKVTEQTKFSADQALKVLDPKLIPLVTTTTTVIDEAKVENIVPPITAKACRVPKGRPAIYIRRKEN